MPIGYPAGNRFSEPLESSGFGTFTCPTCGKTFTTQAALDAHTVSQHGYGGPFYCTVCGQPFMSQGELDAHTATAHTGGGGGTFVCPTCGAPFGSQVALDAHTSTQHGQSGTTYNCTVCGASFPTQVELDAHMKEAHPEEKAYKCTKCTAEFTTQAALDAHMATAHAEEEETPTVPWQPTEGGYWEENPQAGWQAAIRGQGNEYTPWGNFLMGQYGPARAAYNLRGGMQFQQNPENPALNFFGTKQGPATLADWNQFYGGLSTSPGTQSYFEQNPEMSLQAAIYASNMPLPMKQFYLNNPTMLQRLWESKPSENLSWLDYLNKLITQGQL